MSKIEEFKKKKAEFEKMIAEEGKSALTESFKELFDKVPQLESVRWTQYTPYFNDGDECRFSVHEFQEATFSVPVREKVYRYNGPEEFRTVEPGEEVEYWEGDPILDALSEAIQPLCQVSYQCKELFKSAFGDHVRVTATRNGFDVEDYHHD